jgi:hypothetical protein
MAKVQSPLLGYNTNVRHKGKVFHIQTEDSGIQKPHVMTHLFADGGRILKSQKTGYAHLLETDDLSTQVKKLMQDQHKAMFVALREGQFDEMAGVNVVAPAASPEASFPTDESNAVPPAAPTPLTPSVPISRGAPPPPPRSNLPPAPSAPPPSPVLASVPPLPIMVAAPVVAARPMVFGELLVSERSLDEVILAFLAEELEASRVG